MPGMVPPRRPSATPRCHQTRLPVVGTRAEPLSIGLWQPGLGTGCSRDSTHLPHTIRASCRLEAGREGASWERRFSTECPVDGVAYLAVPALTRVQPVAAILRVQRWRLVHDRIRLWKQGVRALEMDISWALPHVRVRVTPWPPTVDAGATHVGSAARPAIPPAPTGGDHTVSALACASRCAPLEGCFPSQANGSYYILTGESAQ
jgi:hypothetical protein